MTLSSEHTYKQKRKELVLGDIDDNDDEMGDVVDDEENLIFVCYFIIVLLHIAIAAKLNRVNQMMIIRSFIAEQCLITSILGRTILIRKHCLQKG